MRIGVIGLGMVGEAVTYGLRELGHTVIPYDTNKDKNTGPFEDLLDTTILFICVPTPTVKGQCDVSIVDRVVSHLARANYRGLAVIKSTVPPGTTKHIRSGRAVRLAFCPEFLRERARFTDFFEDHELCIAGVFPLYGKDDAELIREAHGNLPKNFVVMSPTEAELAKYFVNCFNAQRVVFANAFYDVCKQVGADYNTVKEAVTKRKGIEGDYLTCNEYTREFGGSCLPKDTEAFWAFADSLGLATRVFEMICRENKRVADRKL